jgi:hypothetical protein
MSAFGSTVRVRREQGSSGSGLRAAKVEPEVVVIGKTLARLRAAMETPSLLELRIRGR